MTKVGAFNRIDNTITEIMKLLENQGYTDTDWWSESSFDQDYRPVIEKMLEKIYQYGKTDGKKEAVESLPRMLPRIYIGGGRMAGMNTLRKEVNAIFDKRKKEMLEPLSTPEEHNEQN